MKKLLLFIGLLLTSLINLQAQIERPNSFADENDWLADSLFRGTYTIGYERALAEGRVVAENQDRSIPIKGGQLLDSTVYLSLNSDASINYQYKQIYWYNPLNVVIADSVYEFNSYGNTSRGEKTTHTYNSNDKLVLSTILSKDYDSNSSPSQSRISRSYNANGLITRYQLDYKNGSIWETDRKHTMNYSPAGKLTERIFTNSNNDKDTITIEYNSNNSIKSWSGFNSSQVKENRDSYSYDSNGRIDSIISPTDTLSIRYSSNNLINKTTYGQGAPTIYSYDITGKITKITPNNGDAPDSKVYVYGSNGELLERYSYYQSKFNQDTKSTYEYDSFQRVTKFSSFVYDTLINSYFLDAVDELEYNSAGNLVSYTSSVSYTSGKTTTLFYYNGDETLTSTNSNIVPTPLVYPNPATNTLNILNVEYSSFNVYSLTGQLLLSFLPNNSIDISPLSPGMYVYKTVGDNVFEGKFIKK